MMTAAVLSGRAVFLSSSIPDPERWQGAFDAREISDAVVAASRAVLTAGGTLVTAAHPTIAPLLLYVAGEFPRGDDDPPKVITYQSDLFQSVMPEATARFQRSRVGDFRFTRAAPGDQPNPSQWSRSLLAMRQQMFNETEPAAAVFIGGMTGIREEYELLASRRPAPLFYALARPGGEAALLAQEIESELVDLLVRGDVYPSVFRTIVSDIQARLAGGRAAS